MTYLPPSVKSSTLPPIVSHPPWNIWHLREMLTPLREMFDTSVNRFPPLFEIFDTSMTYLTPSVEYFIPL